MLHKLYILILSILSLWLGQAVANSSLLFTSIPHTQPVPQHIGRVNIPPGNLTGALIRNGFGMFETSGKSPHQFNHLFDTLSLILKFTFSADGRVTYQSRMQPSEYYNQSRTHVPLYRTLGGFTPNLTEEETIETLAHVMHDNLNANILPVTDQGKQYYMTLSDLQGGNFLDPLTLNYMGKRHTSQNTDGDWLTLDFITSTHPIGHPSRPSIVYNYDAIINVNIRTGEHQYHYVFYQQDLTRLEHPKTIIQVINTTRLAYVHSFSLTDNYLVFFEYPMVWNIPAIVTRPVILPTIEWHGSTEPTWIFVIPLRDGDNNTVRVFQTPAMFAFHHINAFETNQTITVDILTYPNGSIFDAFYLDRLRGRPRSDLFPAGLAVRFSLDFASGLVSTRILSSLLMELPTISPMSRSREYRYFYAVGNDFGLYRYDFRDGSLVGWRRAGHYPSEPVYLPGGYLASVTLDASRNVSYLLVVDTRDMSSVSGEYPNMYLDTWIPLSCHGVWLDYRLVSNSFTHDRGVK